MSKIDDLIKESGLLKTKFEELNTLRNTLEQKKYFLTNKLEEYEKMLADSEAKLTAMGVDTKADILPQIEARRDKTKQDYLEFERKVKHNKSLIEEAEAKLRGSGI